MKRITKICFALLVLSPAIIRARTFQVGEHNEYKKISAAIRSASAFDTIIVEGGNYSEGGLIITRPLFIKGINYPIINGMDSCTVITIAASGTTIEGFTIINTGESALDDRAGIKLLRVHNCKITGNKLQNTCFGIFLSNCSHCYISHNSLDGAAVDEATSGGGIHLLHCDSCIIDNNIVEKHRDGIYFEFVSYTRISKNICSNNIRYGLHFMFSNNDDYISNTFRNNSAGVAVMYSKHILMEDNTFKDNWGAASFGLYLKEIGQSTIHNNKFVRNTAGIDMEGSNNISISFNSFTNNGWALKVASDCYTDTVKDNNFENNSFDVAASGTGHCLFSMNYWDDYQGYDLNHDGIGDIPFQPVTLFSMVVQECPDAMILLKSFIVQVLNKAEAMVPAFAPITEEDKTPLMKAVKLNL